MDTFREVVYKIDDKIGLIANITLAANMMVVVVSVIGRVVFKHPIGGLVDIVSFIFVLSCALSICYAEKEKAHVRMDLVLQKLPVRGKLILNTFLSIICLVILIVISYAFLHYCKSTLAANNGSMTIHIPYFPFVVVTTICMILFAITFLINFIHTFDEWRDEK
jgi:TRAP-type C4-dicarboxylate transport system permease small subunit